MWEWRLIEPGARFGWLTVVELSPDRRPGSGDRLYRCQCDCGRELTLRADKLRAGIRKSCGCLRNTRRGE